MNDMTIGTQDAATTPFLGSYQGLDSATLNTLSSLQSMYHQQAPAQNQTTALQDLYSARDTTDPQLRSALIADAVKQLTPAGAQPLQLGAAAGGGITGSPVAVASPVQSGTTVAPSSSDTTGSDPSLTADATANTVDTGRYLITASNAQGGQLTIHDKETGKDTVVWGDPHISVGGKDTAEFQSNGLTIRLDDGTEVQIQPTAKDGGGHAYINQVAVTKGDQAVTMSGFHGGDMHTSTVMNGQAAATQQAYDAPGEDTVMQGDDDQLYTENSNGSMGSQIENTGSGEVDLDQVASGTASGSGTQDAGQMTQLQQAIQNYSSGFMQVMMNSLFSQLMSNSGFNT